MKKNFVFALAIIILSTTVHAQRAPAVVADEIKSYSCKDLYQREILRKMNRNKIRGKVAIGVGSGLFVAGGFVAVGGGLVGLAAFSALAGKTVFASFFLTNGVKKIVSDNSKIKEIKILKLDEVKLNKAVSDEKLSLLNSIKRRVPSATDEAIEEQMKIGFEQGHFCERKGFDLMNIRQIKNHVVKKLKDKSKACEEEGKVAELLDNTLEIEENLLPK